MTINIKFVVLLLSNLVVCSPYNQYVDNIYKNIAWKYTDQNFLKNVVLFYHSENLRTTTEGGLWHVFRDHFESTQHLTQSSFKGYYKQIK